MEHINLEKLRIAVDGIRAMNIPEDKFDMETYGFLDDTTPVKILEESVHTCNTTACFLGWMPLVKGLEPTEECFTGGVLDFQKYPIKILELYEIENPRLWSFLFSDIWAVHAPTLENALERAEIVLNGEFKEDWEYEDYIRS